MIHANNCHFGVVRFFPPPFIGGDEDDDDLIGKVGMKALYRVMMMATTFSSIFALKWKCTRRDGVVCLLVLEKDSTCLEVEEMNHCWYGT